MKTYNINSRSVMNNTPFRAEAKTLEICKPFQNEYGIIYLVKGKDLLVDFDSVYVMSLEENKFDQQDKICLQMDEGQQFALNEFINNIKQKLSQSL